MGSVSGVKMNYEKLYRGWSTSKGEDMGCVICSRCDKFIDLDYNVEGAVVLPDGINWSCIECCEERDEICPECGEPKFQAHNKCGEKGEAPIK